LKQRTYRVSQVARIAGISVRALHHYDALGLLVPSDRTDAGYRLYTDDDLLRLQQILIQRELGFTLEEIRRWLDDPAFDRREALRRQRQEMESRAERARGLLKAIDRALSILEGPEKGMTMTVDMSSLFEGFDPSKYEKEVEERWGETEAYRISKERARRYSEGDWRALKAEQASLYADLARAQKAGAAPDGAEAMDIAERLRLFLERWFYPCSLEMHSRLADMYEADPRFAANIDQHGAGLTAYLCAAIRANAQRNRRSPG
jgi:DNA-binding transcriptional MerR regulator